MPDQTTFSAPEDLMPGARTAVHTCMNVQAADSVLITSDDAVMSVGQALAAAAAETGAAVTLLRLEDYGARPFLDVPAGLPEATLAAKPTVTFYAAASQPGELAFRMKLRGALGGKFVTRHGHMPGVTPRLLREGMTTDYDLIYEITHRVNDIVKVAKTMHVTNPKGTDLRAEFSPELKWIPCHGRYHQPGDWGNLPEGETYTSPAGLEGVIVAEILGDYFSEKYGLLKNPVTFVIENARVSDVRCADQHIADELNAYLDSCPNGRRAGEFAVGTNIGLTRLVGNLLQDEKFPGIHVAFGNPYPQQTGADWSSKVHIDVIPTQCTIDVDGRRIMSDGVFSPEILEVG